jgi:hypothetical protein
MDYTVATTLEASEELELPWFVSLLLDAFDFDKGYIASHQDAEANYRSHPGHKRNPDREAHSRSRSATEFQDGHVLLGAIDRMDIPRFEYRLTHE